MALHINIEDLLSARTVESDRIEYKEGWNPNAIYRSICAFANDFDNIGGGYILIGVEEEKETKTAKRPVKGLTTAELSEIQLKMISFNNSLIPSYSSKLFIEEVDGKQIIVLWIPGGSNRPYQVPEEVTATKKRYFYYIRKYASSVKANTEEQQELISLANQVPFDDRPNTNAHVENISILLVKSYLQKINSKLAEQVGKISDIELLGQMELISGPNEQLFPRNVGLMMFSEKPDKFFPLTQVEIVYFPDGEAAPFQEFPVIQGPIPDQIKQTLDVLRTQFLREKISKPEDSEESDRIWNYPLQAIEETLVNAFFHRDYQKREPIEIRIYPKSIIFLNQGGPDRSIALQSFDHGKVRSRRYRNRRLGEFLKELELTEGRATGIPTILDSLRKNGSPAPRFYSDEDRNFFEVELFIHPAFEKKERFVLLLKNTEWKPIEINKLITRIIDEFWKGDIAGDIAEDLKNMDEISKTAIKRIDRDTVGDIAGGIAKGIDSRSLKLLQRATTPSNRKELLKEIGLAKNAKNFQTYIEPLIKLGWIRMTLPKTPTSPYQKYFTTRKGRLILEFLKHDKK